MGHKVVIAAGRVAGTCWIAYSRPAENPLLSNLYGNFVGEDSFYG